MTITTSTGGTVLAPARSLTFSVQVPPKSQSPHKPSSTSTRPTRQQLEIVERTFDKLEGKYYEVYWDMEGEERLQEAMRACTRIRAVHGLARPGPPEQEANIPSKRSSGYFRTFLPTTRPWPTCRIRSRFLLPLARHRNGNTPSTPARG